MCDCRDCVTSSSSLRSRAFSSARPNAFRKLQHNQQRPFDQMAQNKQNNAHARAHRSPGTSFCTSRLERRMPGCCCTDALVSSELCESGTSAQVESAAHSQESSGRDVQSARTWIGDERLRSRPTGLVAGDAAAAAATSRAQGMSMTDRSKQHTHSDSPTDGMELRFCELSDDPAGSTTDAEKRVLNSQSELARNWADLLRLRAALESTRPGRRHHQRPE